MVAGGGERPNFGRSVIGREQSRESLTVIKGGEEQVIRISPGLRRRPGLGPCLRIVSMSSEAGQRRLAGARARASPGLVSGRSGLSQPGP